MKPVKQTRFGRPHGNCMMACVASILEVPLEIVDFRLPDDATDAQHGEAFRRKLRTLGWAVLELELREADVFWSTLVDVPVIAGGPSPRNPEIGHAVAYVNRELVHDPHPHETGIAGAIETFGVLVPLLPELLHLAAPCRCAHARAEHASPMLPSGRAYHRGVCTHPECGCILYEPSRVRS